MGYANLIFNSNLCDPPPPPSPNKGKEGRAGGEEGACMCCLNVSYFCFYQLQWTIIAVSCGCAARTHK